MKICFSSVKKQIPVCHKLIRGEAVLNPYTLYKMKHAGVNQIIDLRNSAYLKSFLERVFCNILGLQYQNCKYPHRLNELPAHEFFENINNLINNNGKSYIHCQYGKRRTGIAVAIYEKLCLHKPKDVVVSNLFKFGFQDLFDSKNLLKRRKNQLIIEDFFKRYYPNDCNF